MITECPGCHARYDVTGRPPGTRVRCRCGTGFSLPKPVTEADRMRCPSCGAPATQMATVCKHCQTALKIKACPRCFARMFVGAKHCDQCGADVIAPAHADADGIAQKRQCPRCSKDADAPLDGRLVANTLLDECAQCHGIWVDAAAVERIIQERRQATSQALTSLKAAAKSASAGPLGPAGYVPCPDCGKIMNRENFGRRSGVIVDVCRAHGTWFDADELPRVVEYVRRGGLEESHRRDMEQMKGEARRLRGDARAEKIRDRRMHSRSSAEHADSFADMIGDIGGLFYW